MIGAGRGPVVVVDFAQDQNVWQLVEGIGENANGLWSVTNGRLHKLDNYPKLRAIIDKGLSCEIDWVRTKAIFRQYRSLYSINRAFNIRSELWPSAWPVEEPS